MPYVYGIQSDRFIKIGVANDVKNRLHKFQLYNPHPLKIVLQQFVVENYWVENRMHKLLAQYAIGREWFDCSPAQVREAFDTALKEIAADRLAANGHLIVATPQGWKKVPVPVLISAVAQLFTSFA